MSETISIWVNDPEQGRISVTVHPTDSLAVLASCLNGDGRKYVSYKGSFVMTAFTFKFFGIKDGDELCVIRSRGKGLVIDRDYYRHNLKKKRKEETVRIKKVLQGHSTFPNVMFAQLFDNALNQMEWQGRKILEEAQMSSMSLLSVKGTGSTDLSGCVHDPTATPSTEALPRLL